MNISVRLISVVCIGVVSATCGSTDVGRPTAPGAVSAGPLDQRARAGETVPFHSEVFDWHIEQISVPAGHCTTPAPGGYSYLWRSAISATARSTHLGTGPYEVSLCIFGTLTNAAAPPPNNGIPAGWLVEREVWTAANGDQLLATGALLEVIDPVAGKFKESVTFLPGGTGRFAYAEGSLTGIVDGSVPIAIYDGTIRYGRKE